MRGGGAGQALTVRHVKGEGATYVTRTAARATSGCPLTMTLPLRDQLLVDCAVAHGI